MKKNFFAAGIAALAFGIAGIASAATAPCPAGLDQHPVSAKQIKSALTQAFVPCNIPGGNTPNTTTETGTVPTCYPAETYHENAGSPPFGWTWGPKGKGEISFKAGKNKLVWPGYPLNTDPEAVDVNITLKVSDIRDNNTGLVDLAQGVVRLVVRATFVDRVTNDAPMTVDEYMYYLEFQAAVVAGKINTKTSVTVIQNINGQPALPRCTNIEVVSVRLNDANGNTFATPGMFLP